MSDPLAEYSREEIKSAVIALGQAADPSTVVDKGMVEYDWEGGYAIRDKSDRLTELIQNPQNKEAELLTYEVLPVTPMLEVEDGEFYGAVNRTADLVFQNDVPSFGDGERGEGEAPTLTNAVIEYLEQNPDSDPPEEVDQPEVDGPRSWRGEDGEAGTDDDLDPRGSASDPEPTVPTDNSDDSGESDDPGSDSTNLLGLSTVEMGAIVGAFAVALYWGGR